MPLFFDILKSIKRFFDEGTYTIHGRQLDWSITVYIVLYVCASIWVWVNYI